MSGSIKILEYKYKLNCT